MKFLVTALALFVATQAHAAKFESIHKFKNAALEELAQAAMPVAKDQKNFGDAGKLSSFSVERDKSEEDRGTAGQLNHRMRSKDDDDGHTTDMNSQSAKELAETLVPTDSGSENETTKKVRAELEEAFGAVKKVKSLKIFGASHSNEDGTWQVIDVLDTRNNEILFIESGSVGT